MTLTFIRARSYGGLFRSPPNLLAVHSVESDIRPGLCRSLAINWFGGQASTSAHKMFGPDEGIEMVPGSNVAYHCGGGNGGSKGNEHLGRAAFSREQWLANGGDTQLRLAAADAYQECAARGIPWRWLTVAEVRRAYDNPGAMHLGGLCTHNDMRLAVGGTTHTDPGPNFPYDLFLAWGPGVKAPTQQVPQEEDMAHFIMPTVQVWPADKPRPVFMVVGRVAHWMRSAAELDANQKKQVELGQTAEQVATKNSHDIYAYFSATCGPIAPEPFRQDLPSVSA